VDDLRVSPHLKGKETCPKHRILVCPVKKMHGRCLQRPI
jgi:hypothetical protein